MQIKRLDVFCVRERLYRFAAIRMHLVVRRTSTLSIRKTRQLDNLTTRHQILSEKRSGAGLGSLSRSITTQCRRCIREQRSSAGIFRHTRQISFERPAAVDGSAVEHAGIVTTNASFVPSTWFVSALLDSATTFETCCFVGRTSQTRSKISKGSA